MHKKPIPHLELTGFRGDMARFFSLCKQIAAPMENFMSNIKWISIPLEELAKQYNSTIALIKEKMTEKDIPLIEQGRKEAIAKKYITDLLN